ncbi:hypothetical protein AaE_003444, partial [Aphanomyces astaci]
MNHRSSREWTFDAKLFETNLTHLFHACLHTFKMHPNEGNRVVLPDAYLHAMESVLLNYPDCVGIVQFALDANEYGMFVMISRTSHVFAASVWTDLILPFASYVLSLIGGDRYIETERFTEILALILHRHYSMGHVQVYQWIPTLLLPEVAHNHKTRRALIEALLIAL